MIYLTQFMAASTTQIVLQRVASSWPWYVIRGAGFVAAGLLVLLVLSGIGQVTGMSYRFLEPIQAWAVHKALAFALAVSIALHVGFLLIDKFVPFSLVQLLVPFASTYSNGTKLLALPLGVLAVAFGVLAMYGIALLIATSLLWIDSKKRLWRALHYLSYMVAVFIFLHALYTGSDLKYGAFRAAWLVLGALVAVGLLLRLWRAGTVKRANRRGGTVRTTARSRDRG